MSPILFIFQIIIKMSVIHGFRRILGGSIAEKGQFPFQVYLSTDNFYTLHCGGACMSKYCSSKKCAAILDIVIISVLNNLHVLSAAHCIDNPIIKVNQKDIIVIIGITDTENTKDYGLKRQIIQIKVHENYDMITGENDIALLKLNKSVQYSSKIQPVLLPIPHVTLVGKSVTAVGWGADESNICCSRHLLYVDLKVVDINDCKKNYSTNPNTQDHVIDEKMVCVTGLSSVGGICYGDSGGSIILKGTRILIGLASFGNSISCVKGQPDVLTRISEFLIWINKNIE